MVFRRVTKVAHTTREIRADIQSTGAQRAQAAPLENCQPGAAELSAEARRLYARVYLDSQEAELRAAQGRARAADQRDRSHHLHSRRGTQSAGALDRADSRRAREGPSGRALSRGARGARYGGRRQPQAEPVEVWGQAAEIVGLGYATEETH